MEKDKVIKILQTLIPDMDGFQYAMVGSGNLLLQGVDIVPSNLDFLTTDEVVKKMADKYKSKIVADPDYGYIKTEFMLDGADVEFVSCSNNNIRSGKMLASAVAVEVDGVTVYCASLPSEIEAYRRMGRDKDFNKINLIEDVLNNNN